MDPTNLRNSQRLENLVIKADGEDSISDDAYLALLQEDPKETLRRNRQLVYKLFVPFKKGWALESPIKMVFPSGVTDIVVDAAVDFEWSNYPSSGSEKMWFFSLQYAGKLLATAKKYSDQFALDQAKRLISSFIDFCGERENIQLLATIGSADHSASVRINVLIAFYQLSLLGDIKVSEEFRKKILIEIHRWAEWLANVKKPSPNNHGLMAGMSLLYVSLLFDKNGGEKYYNIASERILKLVNNSFDSEGLNNENTIGYHNFNLNLYKKVVNWCDEHEIQGPFVTEIGSVLSRATDALAHCILPTGRIPPIGDSPVYKVDTVQSINKSRLFQESGFAVIKNDNFYLSVICGGRTEFHKHMDDSSIYVQYKGVNLITDGGSYTYDSNRFRKSIASSSGHSGIFPKRLDGLTRRSALRKFGPFPGFISKFEEGEDGIRLACSYSVAGGSIVLTRYICVIWDSEIAIVDKVDGDSSDAVQRFIFGSKVNVSDESNYLRLNSPSFSCTLFHNATEADRYTAEDNEKHVRGWCSVKPNELLPTIGVDFAKPKDHFFSTIISLRGETRLESCSEASMQFANMIGTFFQ